MHPPSPGHRGNSQKQFSEAAGERVPRWVDIVTQDDDQSG